MKWRKESAHLAVKLKPVHVPLKVQGVILMLCQWEIEIRTTWQDCITNNDYDFTFFIDKFTLFELVCKVWMMNNYILEHKFSAASFWIWQDRSDVFMIFWLKLFFCFKSPNLNPGYSDNHYTFPPYTYFYTLKNLAWSRFQINNRVPDPQVDYPYPPIPLIKLYARMFINKIIKSSCEHAY